MKKSMVQALIVPCLVSAVVGPTAFFVHGPTGLAWGLGWGLAAASAWVLFFNARWGLIQGLSAGLSVGVALGPLTYTFGILPGMLLPGLVWGFLGGGVGVLTEESSSHESFGGFMTANLISAGATVILGTVTVGVIGEILKGFTLSGAGFILGITFIGSSWALGCTAGIVVTYLFSRVR